MMFVGPARPTTTRGKASKGAEAMMMTVKDVAKALGVSERSVWRWSSDGTLPPGIKIGGSVRWSQQSVEDWLAKQEHEALAEQRKLAAKKTG